MAINFGPYVPNNMVNPYTGGSYGFQTSPYQPPQLTNIITDIQGFEAAKAYPLGPNTRAYMFDTTKDYLYIKETRSDGFSAGPIKIIKCIPESEEEFNKPLTAQIKEVPVIPQNVITTDNIDDYIADYLAANNFRPYIPRSERRANNEQRVLEVSSDQSN